MRRVAAPDGATAALLVLCGGLALANALRPPTVPALAAGALTAVLLPFAATPRGRLALALCGVALAGLAWGGWRLDRLDRSVLARSIGESVAARLVVTGPARATPYDLRVPVGVRELDHRPVREPALLLLPRGRVPPQGAVIETVVRVDAPRPPSKGFDERTYLRRHGVHVVLRGGAWRPVGTRGGLGGIGDRARDRVSRALARGVDGERRGVLLGLVLGQDEGLGAGLRDSFRASGLYHLLAVSGQNVAFVILGVLLTAWLAGLPRVAGEILALAATGLYVLAVGPQPSVIRAGVAGALGSLAWLCARERDRWRFLLLGALVLLAWNPYTLLDAGFQLSFAAVVAIFVLVPPLRARLEGYPLPRVVRDAVAVSTAVGLATAPILLLEFGRLPVYSVLANALAEPAVPILLWLGFAAVAVDPVAPAAAGALDAANGWVAAYLAGCARLVARLPFATVSAPAALGAIAAGAAAVVLVRRLRRPGRRERAPAVWALAALLVLATAWVGARRPGATLPPFRSGLRIVFLDVGQGDAALLQVAEGAVLIDEGPPEARVDRQLARLGVHALSAMVLTHPQRDHVGGAAAVLRRLRVGTVVDPGIPYDSPEERDALAEARRRGVRITLARRGTVLRVGGLRLEILWPDGPSPPGLDPNVRATVIRASYGDVDALFTADAESDVLLPLHAEPVEILKLSHHGSSDPGLPQLLDELRPSVVAISVAAHNDYGHPAPSTLAALDAAPGVATYRTDRDGAIAVETDGHRIEVVPSR